jgi:hypothetical protein
VTTQKPAGSAISGALWRVSRLAFGDLSREQPLQSPAQESEEMEQNKGG